MNIFFHKTMLATVFFILCVFFFPLAAGSFFGTAHAAEVRLAWDPPDSKMIHGYKIYYIEAEDFRDESDFESAWVKKVTGPDRETCTIKDLDEGQAYYFAATSYRENPAGGPDIESAYSQPIMYQVPVGGYQGDESVGSGGCFIGIAGGFPAGILSD